MSTRRKPQSRNPAAQRGAAAAGTSGADRAVADDGATSAVPVSGAAKGAAVGLWAVVGVGLVYGISQTAVKVVALFNGG